MVKVQNLYKNFGRQQVLKGISFSAITGQITAVIGPSGVGKSVLIKIMMGMLSADKGKIYLDNDEITSLQDEAEKNRIRKKMSILFQSAALFDSLNIYENIAFPLIAQGEYSRERTHIEVIQLAEALNLKDYIWKYPQEVSLGIRKQAGLARALITNPKIVFFDEPNTGLDPLAGQDVYDLIKLSHQNMGFTGLLISHEIPEVFQVCHRVVMLYSGKVVFNGDSEEFMNSKDPLLQQFLYGKIDGPIKIQ